MSKFSTERERLKDRMADISFRHLRIKARNPHSEKLEPLEAQLREIQVAYKALGIPNPDRLTLVPSLNKDGES